MRSVVLAWLLVAVSGCTLSIATQETRSAIKSAKPRVVVTTDPELDDSNSLLRYLLYTTDFQTEGLIYASSGVHWKGDGRTEITKAPQEAARRNMNPCPCKSWRWAENERFVHDAVEKYEQAYPNLKTHDPSFPSPADLRSKIRWGNVEFEGDITKDSEGSRLIRTLLLDDGPEPLYLLAWGGASTIARALKSIKDEFEGTPSWPSIQAKVMRKAIIQSFGDQDGTYAGYIQPNWPGVEFRQMATRIFGYGARSVVLPQDRVYLGAEWTRSHITNRGPMGAHYRVWGDGKQMVKGDVFDHFGFAGVTDEQLRTRGYVVWTPVQEQGSWISEGDTSTFMNLVANGLRGHEQPTNGGWGGRSGQDIGPSGPDDHYASTRFFGTAQRDFAARMQWTVTPRVADANHPPSVRVEGSLDREARPGQVVTLYGSATDPDGHPLQFRWWQYKEAGRYSGTVAVTNSDAPVTRFEVPGDAKTGDTLHLILEVTDGGSPALTRYQRVIVTVR